MISIKISKDNNAISKANAQILELSLEANLLPTYPPKELPSANKTPTEQFTSSSKANKLNKTKLKIKHKEFFIALPSMKSIPRCNIKENKIKVAVSSTIIPPHKPSKQNSK